MREILFRGKHTHMFSSNEPLDGMWCYGYLVDKNYINDKTDRGGGEYLGEMFVDPETVGQYIGRVDRNNVKIFEGDIVSYKEETGTILFDDGEFVVNFGIWSVSICDFYDNEIEVIGNIHDDRN